MTAQRKRHPQDGLHSSLKTILHSKRANIFYLEYCRVLQKDGRILYLTEAREENQFWNIPIANTTCILLGTGTSITQAAMRMLAAAGVLVGFCGGGGTPLLMANEVEWLTPQSEYRPTEYLQGWLSWWFDENARLRAAKAFQQTRIDYLRQVWTRSRELNSYGFNANDETIRNLLDRQLQDISTQTDVSHLLQCEARLTKQLYKHAATCTGHSGFTRDHDGLDLANSFLNHGNYLAYGLGATTAWVLGIPHGFAVMHGKTRRGALVFDIADIVKDALILPYAFICASEGDEEQSFRQQCLNTFSEHKALEIMFDTVKTIALTNQDASSCS